MRTDFTDPKCILFAHPPRDILCPYSSFPRCELLLRILFTVGRTSLPLYRRACRGADEGAIEGSPRIPIAQSFTHSSVVFCGQSGDWGVLHSLMALWWNLTTWYRGWRDEQAGRKSPTERASMFFSPPPRCRSSCFPFLSLSAQLDSVSSLLLVYLSSSGTWRPFRYVVRFLSDCSFSARISINRLRESPLRRYGRFLRPRWYRRSLLVFFIRRRCLFRRPSHASR